MAKAKARDPLSHKKGSERSVCCRKKSRPLFEKRLASEPCDWPPDVTSPNAVAEKEDVSSRCRRKGFFTRRSMCQGGDLENLALPEAWGGGFVAHVHLQKEKRQMYSYRGKKRKAPGKGKEIADPGSHCREKKDLKPLHRLKKMRPCSQIVKERTMMARTRRSSLECHILVTGWCEKEGSWSQ